MAAHGAGCAGDGRARGPAGGGGERRLRPAARAPADCRAARERGGDCRPGPPRAGSRAAARSGRGARATAERLGAAGAEVRAHLGGAEAPLRVEAVRGDRRLEAVRIGDRWCEADLLVLAHRLLPAAFLLRGAGLLDGRPGIPVPVDGRGATPLEGVWAVGTCVAPDVDHVASLEAGMRLGKLVAERRA